MPYAATLEGLGRSLRFAAHGPVAQSSGLSGYDIDVPQDVLDKIRREMEAAIADGIEVGIRRASSKYKTVQTWAKVQVAATVIAAAAGVSILAYLIWKKR
ncbi:MAG: hypothetical protein WCC69_11800 [Pirellulales bacterium]